MNTSKSLNLLFSLLIIFSVTSVYSQQKKFRAVFYNVENLFDTKHDTLKNDLEFTPNGSRFWNNYKFYNKINRIQKTIAAIGEWTPVSFIGLCEIENINCLYKLLNNTNFISVPYKIVHHESPDTRGIDVALLYNSNNAKLLYQNFLKVTIENDYRFKTREILYAKFLVDNKDTIHFFINHWPSRFGGEIASNYKRVKAASILRKKVDSLFSINLESKILIMGDFNDEPKNQSLKETLRATIPKFEFSDTILYNLSNKNDFYGTHKYQGNWAILDQIIISGSLLNASTGAKCNKIDYNIANFDFLLEDDILHSGKKPKSTYYGFKYNDGFSDHLPVYIDIIVNY